MVVVSLRVGQDDANGYDDKDDDNDDDDDDVCSDDDID